MFSEFIENISDDEIFSAHKKIIHITSSNRNCKEITACGLTSNALLYILPNFINKNYKKFDVLQKKEFRISHTTSFDEISKKINKNNIIIMRISIKVTDDLYNESKTKSAYFPNHAMVVCKIKEDYYLFQSYIYKYKLRVSKIKDFRQFISMINHIVKSKRFDYLSSEYWKYITNIYSSWDNYYGNFYLDIFYCVHESEKKNLWTKVKKWTNKIKKYSSSESVLKK